MPPGSAEAMAAGSSSDARSTIKAWDSDAARVSRGPTRLLGFLDQHHGDVVPHRIAKAALQAHDLLGLGAILDLAPAARAHQDLQQLLVHRHPRPPRFVLRPR